MQHVLWLFRTNSKERTWNKYWQWTSVANDSISS